MSEAEMCLRLLAAAALGFAVGLERGYMKKPAGLRTHAIVCVAAALLTTKIDNPSAPRKEPKS